MLTDLSPLDLFLCRYLKDEIFKRYDYVPDLYICICEVFNQIFPGTIARATSAVLKRVGKCVQENRNVFK